MPDATIDPDEFAKRGQEYYDRFLRAELEPKYKGEYLVLDPETGNYEIDPDEMAALTRAEAKYPDRIFYILRVGYRAATCIGAHFVGSGE